MSPVLGSGPSTGDEQLNLQSLKKSLEALIAGERTNQIYYLVTSVVGLLVGVGLIWWTVAARGEATQGLLRGAASGAIPIITGALSATRIAVCESKIAQYKAAAALKGTSVAITIKVIERTLLRGVDHGTRNEP
jgi:hypothetical protein